VDGVGTLDTLTELELIDHEVLGGLELALLDLVVHVHRQLALVDLVADEVPGIRIDDGEIDIAEAHGEVGKERGRQQVDLTGDLPGRVAVDLAIELHLGARLRVGGESGDLAAETLNADREARFDP